MQKKSTPTRKHVFRTTRLTGRPPTPSALGLYQRLFEASGPRDLEADMTAWRTHAIAPWTLTHAGHDVGVGGFRKTETAPGLEILFHFVPEVWGQGLASEFLFSALDHGRSTFRAVQFYGYVATGDAASIKVMERAGFVPDDGARSDSRVMMRLT